MNSTLFLSPWGRNFYKNILMKGRRKFKPTTELKRWNITEGDKVQVIQGPQTGQQGVVLKILKESRRVIIEGVNLRRRIVRAPNGSGGMTKIQTIPCQVHYSNIHLVDPSTG